MIFAKVCICFSVFVIANAFVFDTIFGPKSECKTDADCTTGCCLAVMNSLGDRYNKCADYTLPAGACKVGSQYGCGCMPGYECYAPGTEGLALEPNSHIAGYCHLVNGTGTQIAVEGGR